MQLVPDIGEIVHFAGAIGWMIAVLIIIVLFYKRDTSWVARIYAVGAWLTFSVMRFHYDYFVVILHDITIDWNNPFAFVGLIGGYALIVAAFVQVWSDKKKSNTSNIEITNEVVRDFQSKTQHWI